VYREMTVALIREQKEPEPVQVAFSESARFYRLMRNHPKFDSILRHLREAKTNGTVVRVLVDFPEGDIIEDAEPSR
jgi:hypothetical protein